MKRIAFLLILLITISSCRKEQPAMNKLNENCDCAKVVSANFLLEEMTSNNPDLATYTDTDTIFYNKSVRFLALEESAEYTWYIGSEILNEKEVFRYFNSSLIGQNIPISLVVKKKPNTICLPLDDGYDSVTRHFHVNNNEFSSQSFFSQSNYLMEGTFRLMGEGVSDSVDVTIDLLEYAPNEPIMNVMSVAGLESETLSFKQNGVNYRQYWFNSNYGYGYDSYFLNKISGEVVLKLTPNQGATDTKYFLKGRRL